MTDIESKMMVGVCLCYRQASSGVKKASITDIGNRMMVGVCYRSSIIRCEAS